MRELRRVIKDVQGIRGAQAWLEILAKKGLERGPLQVTLSQPKRSLDQNAKLWAMLHDVAEQVDWHGQNPSAEDWKNIFTSSLKKQRVYPGIDGGFVVCGYSTSRMSKDEFADLIELIYAFGAEHGVEWSETL